MDDKKPRRRLHEIYPNANKMNFNYWERLQRVLDASGTRGQNVQVRKKWIERQTLTNYRNEFDRLVGEMGHLPHNLRSEAAKQLLDEDKIKALGDYIPEKRVEPETPQQQPRRQKRRPNLTAVQREQKRLDALYKAQERAKARIERSQKKRNLK